MGLQADPGLTLVLAFILSDDYRQKGVGAPLARLDISLHSRNLGVRISN